MNVFITEFPRPLMPMQATEILSFGATARTDGAAEAAAMAPAVFKK
jgi:hypothetical protein